MKQISTFMSEISDEFKIVVVHAIRLVIFHHFLFLFACPVKSGANYPLSIVSVRLLYVRLLVCVFY